MNTTSKIYLILDLLKSQHYETLIIISKEMGIFVGDSLYVIYLINDSFIFSLHFDKSFSNKAFSTLLLLRLVQKDTGKYLETNIILV